ncbi:hypothetical protein [Rhodococcus spongiicola]|uniref:Fe-S oxidoreductase n=1 Tax=Rhodococcus spongiicola TaxID=2487352 RepID=A0A438B0T3_9NOCA|nr:hypothetical protein [Rhodococcus spongiicola]RVW04563.1 hypothetical protein EF834_05710 [Rhodococcus spongiicola]
MLARASRGSRSSRLVTVVALRYARLRRARIEFDDEFGIFVCSGMRGGFSRGGMTLGGAYLTNTNTCRRVLRHEVVHADQWGCHGAVFALLYLWEEMRNPKARNRYEIAAGLGDGGYTSS